MMLVSVLLGGLGYASGAIAPLPDRTPGDFLGADSRFAGHACCRLVERTNAARCSGFRHGALCTSLG